MRDVVIFGSGQVAEVIHYYLCSEGQRNVVAFTADQQFRKQDELLGLPVVDFETVHERFSPKAHDMFVAASFKRVNRIREEMVGRAREKGYELTSFVSPHAAVWRDFILNPNTFIMEHNVVQPYVTIGQNVIIWSGNHIGHHTSIGDHCFIASHAVISGSVTIGSHSFVGVNATIRDNVKIGSRNVLGAATLILADTPDEAVFIGNGTPISKVPSSRLRSI